MATKKEKPVATIEEETVEEVVTTEPAVEKKAATKAPEKKEETHKKSGGKEKDSNLLAALGYIIGVLAIILYFVKPNDKYVRFHALQSVLLWVGVIVVMVVFGIGTTILSLIPVINVLACITGVIAAFFWVIGLIAALYCAWKSYNGEEYELPYIGAMAKKHV